MVLALLQSVYRGNWPSQGLVWWEIVMKCGQCWDHKSNTEWSGDKNTATYYDGGQAWDMTSQVRNEG